MNIKYLLLGISVAALGACSDKLADKPQNKYGNPGRTNSYSEFDQLRYNVVVAKKFVTKDTSGAGVAPLILAGTKMAIVTNEGSLILTQNGELLSEEKFDVNVRAAAGLCSSPTGKICIQGSNGKIYIFSELGKKETTIDFISNMNQFEIFSDLLSCEDGFYAASSRGIIAKFSYDGKKMWERNFNLPIIKTFAANKSGDVAIGLTNNEFGASDNLVLLGKSGDVKWTKELPGSRIAHFIAMTDDKIYVPTLIENNGERNSKLYVLDLSGNIKWETSLPLLCKYVSVDKDEKVYISGSSSGAAENQTGLYCFNPDGSQKWQIYIRIAMESPVIIGSNTLAVMGSSKYGPAMLYFMKESGILMKDISLADLPSFLYSPAIETDGSIYYALNTSSGVIEIKESLINKILPF